MAPAHPSIARKSALGLATAAAMVTSATAKDFTQEECKGIRVTAGEIVRTIGKDTLSMEFRQSLVNWMGPDLRCNGPKEIVIVTHNDDATYATIRETLLLGSKPLSLQKAGLRVVVKPAEKVSAAPPAQRRSDAAPAPAVN